MINFTTVLEMLKSVRTSTNHLNDAMLKQNLLDLQGHLLNLQVQMLEQQVDNRGLQNEVVRMRECLATERRLERVFDAYMVVESPTRKRGPFCAVCWNKRQTLQALVEGGEGLGYCPSCKSKPRIAAPEQEMVNAS
ncbi:MAG: hypothetical protein ABJB66_08045 [Gemmatimonadaceae bacterium]